MAAIEFEWFSCAPSAQVYCRKLTDDAGWSSGIVRRGRFVGCGFEVKRYRKEGGKTDRNRTGVCLAAKRALFKTWRNSFYTWQHKAHTQNKRFDYKKIVSDYKVFKGTPFGSFRDDWEDYLGYNPSHSTVYNALSTSGFVSPRAYIPVREKRHLPRSERPNEGDLIQIDASCHDWFMNGQEIALHEAIDDATHKIVGLYFCANECLLGLLSTFNTSHVLSRRSSQRNLFR